MRQIRIFIAAFAGAFALCGAAHAMIFVKIPNMGDDSVRSRGAAVEEATWGDLNAKDAPRDDGPGSLTLAMKPNGYSDDFKRMQLTGAMIPSMTLTTDEDGKATRIELQIVQVTDYQISAAGVDPATGMMMVRSKDAKGAENMKHPPREHVSFTYQKIIRTEK